MKKEETFRKKKKVTENPKKKKNCFEKFIESFASFSEVLTPVLNRNECLSIQTINV